LLLLLLPTPQLRRCGLSLRISASLKRHSEILTLMRAGCSLGTQKAGNVDP